jgi:hypothetical protein
MSDAALSGPQDVSDRVLSWINYPDAGRLRSDSADWGPAEWDEARRTIDLHGVAPHLYVALRRAGALGTLASAMAVHLAAEHERCARRRAAIRAELVRLLAVADETDLPLVPLEEPALVTDSSDATPPPPITGLSLLVRPRDERRLTGALSRAGWSDIVRNVGAPVVLRAERRWTVDESEAPLQLEVRTSVDARAGGIHFDLTWACWYEARRRAWAGIRGLLPSPLRFAQHLLIQTSERLMGLGLRLVDLLTAATVTRTLGPRDWQILVEEARNQGEQRLFWTPLRLAERYVGPSAPTAVMDALRGGVPPALREWTEEARPRDFAAQQLARALPAEASRWCRSSWERLLLITQMLAPSPDEVATRGRVPAYLEHARALITWPLQRWRDRAEA